MLVTLIHPLANRLGTLLPQLDDVTIVARDENERDQAVY